MQKSSDMDTSVQHKPNEKKENYFKKYEKIR